MLVRSPRLHRAALAAALALAGCGGPTAPSPWTELASLWEEADIVTSRWPASQQVFVRFAVLAPSCARGKTVEVDVDGLEAEVRPYYLVDERCVERGAVVQTHDVTVAFETFAPVTVFLKTAGGPPGDTVVTELRFEAR